MDDFVNYKLIWPVTHDQWDRAEVESLRRILTLVSRSCPGSLPEYEPIKRAGEACDTWLEANKED